MTKVLSTKPFIASLPSKVISIVRGASEKLLVESIKTQ